MALSPMMRHYIELKENYKDCIVFYRLGDFYEMFFDDAITASKVLEITLTGRDCGLESKAPMCGVPFHAVDTYIAKLVNRGYKVAICEQLTEPSKKGIVERDVLRVITPGMVIENNILDENKNNYIASVCVIKDMVGIAYLDISTGEFFALDKQGNGLLASINDELLRIAPSEIICNDYAYEMAKDLGGTKTGSLPRFDVYFDWAFDYDTAEKAIFKQFGIKNLSVFDLQDKEAVVCAVGALVEYITQTQKRALPHLNTIKLQKNESYLYLDSNTRRNLELVSSMRDGKRKGTLLSVLDETSTTMGARLIRTSIEQPLQNGEEINSRLDAVGELYDNYILRQALASRMSQLNDIERMCSKIAYKTINPREVKALRESLDILPDIKSLLSKCNAPLLKSFCNSIADFGELNKLLHNAISDEPPYLARDGGMIREGYDSNLDDLRNAKRQGANWIAQLEAEESKSTGIKNLKIKFNRVFGYFIEINKQYSDIVPLRYTRKQTVANNERYITEELKIFEDKILNAEEQSLSLEIKLYENVIENLITNVNYLLKAGQVIANIDMLVSFASVSKKYNYCRPIINEQINELKIVEGRHPVVETMLKNDVFVPNDLLLNNTDNKTMIITGPNMAGKSTYMRQVALIVLMAHLGCFVPAKSANIPICDRIFTRVGASDELAFGFSTFMMEMSEVATILSNATNRSLIILDEVGRGTATYDGLSIAWSIIEYLSKYLSAKTLFATHYHELTDLEGMLEGVKNYHISVKEVQDSVVFLRKIVRGGTNKSFGIEVAQIAGVPKEITSRAKEILKLLTVNETKNLVSVSNQKEIVTNQIQGINNEKIIKQIKNLEINEITPFMAMEILDDLIKLSKEE